MKLSGWHSIAYVNIGANLMDIPIDVDKDNQLTSMGVFHGAKLSKHQFLRVQYYAKNES